MVDKSFSFQIIRKQANLYSFKAISPYSWIKHKLKAFSKLFSSKHKIF